MLLKSSSKLVDCYEHYCLGLDNLKWLIGLSEEESLALDHPITSLGSLIELLTLLLQCHRVWKGPSATLLHRVIRSLVSVGSRTSWCLVVVQVKSNICHKLSLAMQKQNVNLLANPCSLEMALLRKSGFKGSWLLTMTMTYLMVLGHGRFLQKQGLLHRHRQREIMVFLFRKLIIWTDASCALVLGSCAVPCHVQCRRDRELCISTIPFERLASSRTSCFLPASTAKTVSL